MSIKKNKILKKIMCLSLLSQIIFYTGCSSESSESSVTEISPSVNEQIPIQNIEDSDSEKIQIQDNGGYENQSIMIDNSAICNLDIESVYQNGATAIGIFDSSNRKEKNLSNTYIIADNSGNALFRVSAQPDMVTDGDSFSGLEVRQYGSRFCVANAEYQSGINDNDYSYNIKNYFVFDLSGNILFDIDFTSGSSKFETCGGGYLAVSNETGEMNGSNPINNVISIYDIDGNLCKEFVKTNDTLFCAYAGSGVFELMGGNYKTLGYYNVKSDKFFEGNYGWFFDNKTVALDNNGVYSSDGSLINSFDAKYKGYSKSLYSGIPSDVRFYSDYWYVNLSHHRTPNAPILDDIVVAEPERRNYFILNTTNMKETKLENLNDFPSVLVDNGYIAIFANDSSKEYKAYSSIYDYDGNCIIKASDIDEDFICKYIYNDKAIMKLTTDLNSLNMREPYRVYDLKTGKEENITDKYVPITDFSDGVRLVVNIYDGTKRYQKEDGSFIFGDEFDQISQNIVESIPQIKPSGNYKWVKSANVTELN